MNFSRFTNPVNAPVDLDRAAEIEAEKADRENDIGIESDPDNEFRGWPPMPEIQRLPDIMTAEELARRLK